MKKDNRRLVPLVDYLDIESDDPELYQIKVAKVREAGAIVPLKSEFMRSIGLGDTEDHIDLNKYDAYHLAFLDFLKARAKETPSLDTVLEYEVTAASIFYDRQNFIQISAENTAERFQNCRLETKHSKYYQAARKNFDAIFAHVTTSQELFFSFFCKRLTESGLSDNKMKAPSKSVSAAAKKKRR